VDKATALKSPQRIGRSAPWRRDPQIATNPADSQHTERLLAATAGGCVLPSTAWQAMQLGT
jgi:hypothetical protein